MNRRLIVQLLFFETWWEPKHGWPPWYDALYRGFNLIEGVAWLWIAGLVLDRYRRNRKSRLEWLYAGAFLTFGLTDFRESIALQSWLVWVKLANLILLIWLRQSLRRRFYPESRFL